MSDNEEKPRVQGGEVRAELKFGTGSNWRPSRRRYDKSYNGTTPSNNSDGRKPLVTVAEPLPAPKPRVDFHVEKRGIILLNGKVTHVSSCTATDCYWSDTPDAHDNPKMFRKTHSDGKRKHELPEDDLSDHLDEVLSEAETDTIQPLDLTPKPPVAGADDDPLPEESEIGQDDGGDSEEDGQGDE